jgi:hypothetical protein
MPTRRQKRKALSVASDVSDTENTPRTSARTTAVVASASTQPDKPSVEVIELDGYHWEDGTRQHFRIAVDSHQLDIRLQQTLVATMDSWAMAHINPEVVSTSFSYLCLNHLLI